MATLDRFVHCHKCGFGHAPTLCRCQFEQGNKRQLLIDIAPDQEEKMRLKQTILISLLAVFSIGHVHAAGMSEEAVIDAQITWGEGIVAISKLHSDGGDYEARATEHIETLYAYGETDVMFKPTLASEDQFRETFEEALSYFIGTEGSEDHGFAIKGWTKVRWENNGIYVDEDSAMAMGNYYFTGPDGSETKAEFSFGYVLDDADRLIINLHHSSLPYSPK